MKLGRKIRVMVVMCKPRLLGDVVAQGQVPFICGIISLPSLGPACHCQPISQARELRLREIRQVARGKWWRQNPDGDSSRGTGAPTPASHSLVWKKTLKN